MFRKMTSVCLAFVCTTLIMSGVSAESASDVRLGSVTWPTGQALPSFAKPKQLQVAEMVDAPGDIKLLLATLQGIVNREEPRMYLIENAEEGKYTWLNDLNVPYTVHEDYWDLVAMFKDEVKGVVVYDPSVPDSINVATTLAGVKDAVATSPEVAEILTASPYDMTVVEDLRGKFKDRIDAYTWQFEHLWSETSHRMLVGLSPNVSVKIPPGLPASFRVIAEETTQERGAKNRKTYDLDLSEFLGKPSVYLRFDDAFPQDGWGPAVHEVTVKADGQVIAQFIPGTPEEEPFLYDRQSSQLSSGSGGHRFADNGRYFVYQFTPPSGTKQLIASVDMWNQFKVSAGNVQPPSSELKEPYGYLRDYAVANRAMVFWLESNVPEQKALFEKILSSVQPGTPYLGWFSNDVEGEFSGVEIASSYGVYVLAADWFSNMSVFSGTKLTEPAPKAAVKAPELENKIYVTYTFSEGDNFQYNQHRLRILWDDPNRGKVPINWTSSPLLYDGAPAFLNYYFKTATDNDQIIAGPSGAGYFYPNVWPEDSFSKFLQRTYPYLEKTGMTIPYVLNRIDGGNVPLSKAKADAYKDQYHAPGLFLSWENRHGIEVLENGLPVSVIHGISTVEDGKRILDNAKANWDGQSPLFVSLGLLAWSMTPSDVLRLNESLGQEFEAVRADQYFTLVREAYGLPKR
ncbi:GxGYxYP domain-containing protein [Paenibacillus thermotolerans]|uniref:GxGYxYP domain-containing protein n=1 Tax=Paenibacillus thermotolerans TaxID=3027807 RepID=UPI002367B63C|nr:MULTISPECIES: GxGYxYP domain-containing protein [unclassified Paenibacillus]